MRTSDRSIAYNLRQSDTNLLLSNMNLNNKKFN